MYPTLLMIHSLLRWVVLLGGLGAVALGLRGLIAGSPVGALERRTNLVFLIATDTQLLIGLLLYGVYSPMVRQAFSEGMGSAMKNSLLRYWAVEHVTMMVLAVVVLHVTQILAKKGATDKAKSLRATVGFGIALVLILAGIPWPFLAAGRPLFPF